MHRCSFLYIGYIYPEKTVSLWQTFLSFGASFVRESLYYVKHKHIDGIPYLLLNRFVYAWHYYTGFVHAKKSKNSITFGNYQ